MEILGAGETPRKGQINVKTLDSLGTNFSQNSLIFRLIPADGGVW